MKPFTHICAPFFRLFFDAMTASLKAQTKLYVIKRIAIYHLIAFHLPLCKLLLKLNLTRHDCYLFPQCCILLSGLLELAQAELLLI